MVYKVIFKGSNKIEKEKLSLTFKEVELDSGLRISIDYLNKLRQKKDAKIITFQNIEAVIKFGKNSTQPNYNYYNVILFSLKAKKQGILIGNSKKKGDILVGIWPFNKEFDIESIKYLNELFNDLLVNPIKFQEICIIN